MPSIKANDVERRCADNRALLRARHEYLIHDGGVPPCLAHTKPTKYRVVPSTGSPLLRDGMAWHEEDGGGRVTSAPLITECRMGVSREMDRAPVHAAEEGEGQCQWSKSHRRGSDKGKA